MHQDLALACCANDSVPFSHSVRGLLEEFIDDLHAHLRGSLP